MFGNIGIDNNMGGNQQNGQSANQLTSRLLHQLFQSTQNNQSRVNQPQGMNPNQLQQFIQGGFGSLPPSNQNQGAMGGYGQYNGSHQNQPLGDYVPYNMTHPQPQMMPQGGQTSTYPIQSPYLSHSKPPGMQTKTLQQRRDMAKSFFRKLKLLPKPTNLANFGNVLDTERILQVLTNAQFVEKKNQFQMRRESQDDQQLNSANMGQQIYTEENGVKSYYRGEDQQNDEQNIADTQGAGATGGIEEDWRFLDMEDKKILNKRKRRVNKIEDCYLDLDLFFKQKKRFKPSDILLGSQDNESTVESDKNKLKFILNSENKKQLQSKIIERYFSELPENQYTQRSMINYIKYIIKNVQLSKLTIHQQLADQEINANDEFDSENVIIEWIKENDPNLLIEIATFWIYNAFNLDDQAQAFYKSQLNFILNVIHQNSNLVLYSDKCFMKWLDLIKSIPRLGENSFVLDHVMNIIQKMSIEQYERGLLKLFMDTMILDKMALKSQLRTLILNLVLEQLMFLQQDQLKFNFLSTQILFKNESQDQSLDDQIKMQIISFTMQKLTEVSYIQMQVSQLQQENQYKNLAQMIYLISNNQNEQTNKEILQNVLLVIFKSQNQQLRMQLILILKKLFACINLKSDNQLLLDLITQFSEEKMPDFKKSIKIVIDSLAQCLKEQQAMVKNEQEGIERDNPTALSPQFKDLMIQIAKQNKCSSILCSILLQLSPEQINEHLPQITMEVQEDNKLVSKEEYAQLLENIENEYGQQQDRVAELIYLILKQKFDNSGATKQEIAAYVARIKIFQDVAISKFNQDTIVKVLERLIKNEKWHQKSILALISLLLKKNSVDKSGQDSSFKEQALSLIKKILKKKVWEQTKDVKDIDNSSSLWEFYRFGLVLYFVNNHSKEKYRLFKDNIPGEVREEIIKSDPRMLDFINTYSRR
eukprot:403372662